MTKVVYIDQGHPDDNFYGLADEYEDFDISDLTLEEMDLTLFAAQLDVFIQQVGPALPDIVLNISNFNEMCMKLTELKKRERL